MNQSPILAIGNGFLWLKVLLSAATLVVLYVRYRKGKTPHDSSSTSPFRPEAMIVLAVLFSFAIYHNFGTSRDDVGFVHYPDMFHYYLGTKYFKEVGYSDLYNAVIVADTEQENELVGLPFYTDLKTYRNIPRAQALADADRIRSLFSNERWTALGDDVAFFKTALGVDSRKGLMMFVMDHGYNGSPVSTLVLGTLANIFPVTQLRLLAVFDVFLVVAMGALVFRTFGFELGALFSVYFCLNVLNASEFLSGCFLRYDWLFYVVVAVCLLERKRYASAAFFLTLSAMIRIFPAALFYGLAVIMFKNVRATGVVDRKFKRFIAAAGVTGAVLFLLPATFTGSVLQPWKDFAEKLHVHESGVYVNHLGFREIALFEPSHLSLEKFVEAYRSTQTNDIVRHWQEVKAAELEHKRPIIWAASLLVLLCLTTVIWKRESETESVVWPLLLVYTASNPAHYYYAFLCLFVLLFFRRPNALDALVPLCLLLALNIGILVTDSFGPSPIVFYTLANIYLFICVCSILGFELYAIRRPVPHQQA